MYVQGESFLTLTALAVVSMISHLFLSLSIPVVVTGCGGESLRLDKENSQLPLSPAWTQSTVSIAVAVVT